MINIEMMKDAELELISGGLSVSFITGVNSPKGTNEVVAPPAAIEGALNAFTQVATKGPGDIANIAVVVGP